MSGKDATLESIRVSVRKLEKAVAPFEQLAVRLGGLERKFGAFELKINGLLSSGLVARARRAGLLDSIEPEPALEPEVTPPALPSGEDLAETIKAAMGEFSVQVGETIRDALAGLIAPPPARPKNGSSPMVSDDLGVDARSVVAFDQTKG